MSLTLKKYGKYLGTEKFNFIVKYKEESVKEKPFYEVDEINRLKMLTGNN